MRVVIAGGTGFIGQALVRELVAAGHSVTILSRSQSTSVAGASVEQWDGRSLGPWVRAVDGADAIINLAGENLGKGRWSASRKATLLASRIEPTRALVEAMRNAAHPPGVFISASGSGYYGNRPEGEVEETASPGNDFLATLCLQWEAEARKAPGARVVILRTGVVLGPGGGVIPRFLLPFRLFVGGPLGSGKQWLPWIHRDDLVRVIAFALGGQFTGAVNAVAPESVTMKGFCDALGKALHRPSWAPVPSFVLRIVLGEMASIVLTGQNAVPKRLLAAGYTYRYPRVEDALGAVFQKE